MALHIKNMTENEKDVASCLLWYKCANGDDTNRENILQTNGRPIEKGERKGKV